MGDNLEKPPMPDRDDKDASKCKATSGSKEQMNLKQLDKLDLGVMKFAIQYEKAGVESTTVDPVSPESLIDESEPATPKLNLNTEESDKKKSKNDDETMNESTTPVSEIVSQDEKVSETATSLTELTAEHDTTNAESIDKSENSDENPTPVPEEP